jgi:diguanylate cyclase (GGDEF)-like protein
MPISDAGGVTPPDGDDRRSLELLNDVARIASLDLELRPMLQRITDALQLRFHWEFVALVSIDVERQAFVCEALSSSVDSSVHVGYSRALGSGVVGEVAASGRAVLLDDVNRWPNYIETMPGARAELCVPVKHHGRIVAILNLESTRPAAFEGQLELLETVADQIAGAIASAQLYDELRQRARLMQMMSEVSRTALQATDLQELLDRIVRYIRERFPLEFAAMVMFDGPSRELVHTAIAGDVFLEPAERWPLDRGVIGRCLRTATTQYVADVRADPEYVPLNERVTSELAVPIRFQDEILGALNLESASADAFTPANVLAFEAFADQVAGAIHMASVNERLADTTKQLEAKTRALEDANEHLSSAVETLHRISSQDGLTGVANRRHFDDTLTLEWRRAARRRSMLSLLMLDIDFFKAFNDGAGHQAGDECLRRVAQTLSDALQRAGDLVARYGGEEFAVLLPETDSEHAQRLAWMLRDLVSALDIPHPASLFRQVTVSIGVATLVPPPDGTGAQEFVRVADDALYDAKRQGRNRVVM